MKVLCFADFHLGVKVYGKTDHVTGLNTREINALNILDSIVDYAIDNKIDIIAFAGDAYKNNIPVPSLQDEFNKRIKRAADNNIIVLLLDGNHDVSKLSTSSSPLKQFGTLSVNNVIHTKEYYEYTYNKNNESYKFVFLPTHHTKEDIENILDNVDTSIPTIFLGHLTIKGALLNDWLIEDKEIYIESDKFKKDGVLAVILGHLHKFQILEEKPLMFYTGSSERIDFNEENQKKGFVVLDIKDSIVNYEFVEVDAQRFLTIKLDITSQNDAQQYIEKFLSCKKNEIFNSIVRIKLDLNEETKIDEKSIYECLNSYGAYHILNIQKNFVDCVLSDRNSNITENINVFNALELYYKDKNRADERIKIGKELISQVEEDYEDE